MRTRAAAVLAAALSLAAATAAAAPRIVLIGGKKSHGPGEHDYPTAIPLLASALAHTPAFARATIVSHPGGWPADLAELDGAATVVLYFDGLQETPPPLLDPARLARLRKLMAAGAGLVCLHQASTVPANDTTIPLVEWLGARRNGMVDRATETVDFAVATPTHPVARGLTAFSYRDEIYPTLELASAGVVPILTAVVPRAAGKSHVVAWAFERAGGGRSFGFTGGHFVQSLEQPQVRRMLLAAIAWTARLAPP